MRRSDMKTDSLTELDELLAVEDWHVTELRHFIELIEDLNDELDFSRKDLPKEGLDND
jgi:hypothetical protein